MKRAGRCHPLQVRHCQHIVTPTLHPCWWTSLMYLSFVWLHSNTMLRFDSVLQTLDAPIDNWSIQIRQVWRPQGQRQKCFFYFILNEPEQVVQINTGCKFPSVCKIWRCDWKESSAERRMWNQRSVIVEMHHSVQTEAAALMVLVRDVKSLSAHVIPHVESNMQPWKTKPHHKSDLVLSCWQQKVSNWSDAEKSRWQCPTYLHAPLHRCVSVSNTRL